MVGKDGVKRNKKSYVAAHQNHKRVIRTVFTNHLGEIIKINRSAHAHAAVMKAVDYLQRDYYTDARVVEVYDDSNGVLHAIIAWKDQSLVVLYKRDPRIFISSSLDVE